ncbi:MAG: glucan biosynthesis protein [Sphingobium sp.]|nr:glucan biosynthesis protein [Sphingobium sp.]
MPISRRDLMLAGSAALGLPSALRASAPRPFSRDWLIGEARRRAAAPYRETPANPNAAKVGYDALNKAQFRPEREIWANGDYGIRLFPLSGTAPQPVGINLVENGTARPLTYSPDFFTVAPGHPVEALGTDAGFAGFRVMNAAKDGDWLAFMGASYFRANGAQNQYGLSARAIAIDTAKGPEEFPRFTDFWLERLDGALAIHALLDGPSIAGAYSFLCKRAKDGVHQDVRATLFPRKPIAELGLMAMSSMFWYDQAHQAQAIDWRPEVHDSDGLEIVRNNGERLFRPLINPPKPHDQAWSSDDMASFGLLQRDRNFDHYQDDGVFYDRRPSLWVRPGKLPGAGRVRLYEFTAGNEYADNVAAWWTPDEPVRPGKRIDADYQLDWRSAPLAVSPLAELVDLRRGISDADVASGGAAAIRLVADFAGGGIERLPRGALEGACTVTNGRLIKAAAYPILSDDGRWRLVLDIAPSGTGETRVAGCLVANGAARSERFDYPLL